MAVLKAFADVLKEFSEAKKTGALYVSVSAASENLVRFYLKDGEIYNMSYGTIRDKECLDILDCYEFTKAVYFDGMKAPAASKDLPKTAAIIEMFNKSGKKVTLG